MNDIKNKFSVFIGLDWANKKHDICVQIGDSGNRSYEVILHSPESIDTWTNELHRKVKGNIAIAVELTKGPIVYALQKYNFVTVFPIHGLTLSRYRKAMFPSGSKDDPMDAELALDMMLNYPNKIKALRPSSDDSRTLAQLVEHRRMLVEDKRRNTNRLINALKQYYPQPLELFSHRNTELFCDFLIKWPTFDGLKRAKTASIEKFFHAHGGHAMTNLKKRIKAIDEAQPLTKDSSVILPHKLLVVALCKQLLTLNENIRVYDKEISELFNSMPGSELFNSLPGTGLCLVPRLLAALGEDRSRFNSAEEIQNYAGLSPVTERSGQKSWVHWRWQCSKFIRQSFIEWSAKSVHQSFWASLYYANQRAKGKSHQSAVRALAYKWVRIVYRCWKTRKPYDESKYLKALKERNSPLLAT